MAETIRVGTRRSALARRQTDLVVRVLRERWPDLDVSVETIETGGDRFAGEIGAGLSTKGLFVKEIEEALMEGRIDIAVHSMKDLPSELPSGLRIAAVPKRADPRDALLGCSSEDLRARSRVGTGSPRRRAQLLHRLPEIEIVPLRGNVDTRIRKRKENKLDAIVLAVAGLERLGIEEAIEALDPSWMLPAPGQGALALEIRTGDTRVETFVQPLHDPESGDAVFAEREFLRFFGAGCAVPLAALARIQGREIHLEALISDPDGRRLLRDSERGDRGDPAIARRLGERLIRRGAQELLSA